MKNLFQNKFMVITLIISILLVGTTSFISALGYTSYVRNAIGIVLTPLQKGADTVIDGIEGIFSTKKDIEKLKEENQKLKEELAKLNNTLAEAQLALTENAELKEYLGIKSEHTDLCFENAKVTGRQSGSHTAVYTVDKGTHHGIEPGMAVIDKYGLIGCVTEVGLTWSKVTAVTEPDVSVGGTVERTGDEGVVSGTFSAAQDGFCILSYLPEQTDVKVGDRIITSDESSVYPAGLLIGTVEKTEYSQLSRELTAYVRPASNLTEVSSVMIITEYESTYE